MTDMDPDALALQAGDYPGWYRLQIDRIKAKAARAPLSPEVLATLAWSLPYLRAMATGAEPPVLPPVRPQSLREVRVLNRGLGRAVLKL